MQNELDIPYLRELVRDYNLPLSHLARRAKTSPCSISSLFKKETVDANLYDVGLRVKEMVLIMIKERQMKFGVMHAKGEPYLRKFDKQLYDEEKRSRNERLNKNNRY